MPGPGARRPLADLIASAPAVAPPHPAPALSPRERAIRELRLREREAEGLRQRRREAEKHLGELRQVQTEAEQRLREAQQEYISQTRQWTLERNRESDEARRIHEEWMASTRSLVCAN